MASAESARPEPPRALIALLAACSITGPIGTSFFIPALPAVGAHFSEPIAAVQATISAYLIAFAIGILVTGPMADRFGRRPVILVGLSVFAFGALLAALAPTLPLLIAARIVQGLGGAAGITVARATAADLYEGPELARKLATLTMAMVLGTGLAPWIGGILTTHLGWQSGFYTLLAFSATIVIAAWRLLPETRPGVVGDDRLFEMLRQARTVLSRGLFFRCAIEAGVIYAVFLVFISVAPHLMVDLLHRPASDFGVWYLVLAGGYFLGNFFVSRIAGRGRTGRIVTIGLSLQCAGALTALAFALAGWHTPLALFAPMFPLAIGQGLALPIVTARAVSLAPGFAGVASSLIGFAQQSIAALGVQAMGWAPTTSPVWVMSFCAIASLLAVLGSRLDDK